MKKMNREDMGYNKAKLVCSNCDGGVRNEGQDIYTCYKIEGENNWVQPHGFCDFHSGKLFEGILKNAKDRYKEEI